MKIALRITAISLIAFLAVVAAVLGSYAFRVQHFDANPANGYSADFYLYVSPDARHMAANNQVSTILVQPNHSGINIRRPSSPSQRCMVDWI